MPRIITGFLHSLFVKATGSLVLLAAFACSLASCGDDSLLNIIKTRPSPTTSGEDGQYIETSNLAIVAETYYLDDLHPTHGTMTIHLRRNDTLEVVRLGSTDDLTVTLGGIPLTINESGIYGCDGPVGPCQYYYGYSALFDNGVGGNPVTINFSRLSGDNGSIAGTLPPNPVFSSPSQGSNIHFPDDPLTVSWQAGETGDHVDLELRGDCVYAYKFIPEPTNSVAYSAGDPDLHWYENSSSCETASSDTVVIKAVRTRSYDAAEALGPYSLLTLSTEDLISISVNR